MPGIVIHEGRAFFICDALGNVKENTEQGLYYEDTRFLSHYQLTINGEELVLLSSRQVDYYSSIHYLTNPILGRIPSDSLLIERSFFVGNGLNEDLDIVNLTADTIRLNVELRFKADFADIFEVKRGGAIKKRALPMEANRRENTLSCGYTRENFIRKLIIRFEQVFQVTGEGGITFEVELQPRATWHTGISYLTLTSSKIVTPKYGAGSFGLASAEKRKAMDQWIAPAPRLVTNWEAFSHAYERSLLDVGSLRLEGKAIGEKETVLAAGVPWYMTVFGRDTLITAYQVLPFFPGLAKEALTLLAKYQGKEENPGREEEPGKIPHEIRSGELATVGEVSFKIYYGTVDATILYLIVLSEYYRWTGDVSLVKALSGNALAALDWMDLYGDQDGDGYVEYQQKGGRGLANQGWKDSGNAICFADGTLATPPIALSEVQGYAYDAKLRMAELMPLLGKSERADDLAKNAEDIKKRFNEDFWMDKEDFFAEALDKDKRRVDSITSNPGHALWSGIVDREKAASVARRLLKSDMFSGWGIRTLSSKSAGYSPLSYHNGSVWPHDNSIIVAGLARYGFAEEAAHVIEALIQASTYFPENRLPELFCGLYRTRFDFPVEYPASSSPQAWSAGSILLFLRVMLGISVGVPEKRIEIRPMLPPPVKIIDVDNFPAVGGALSLHLEKRNGRVDVHCENKPEGFELVIG